MNCYEVIDHNRRFQFKTEAEAIAHISKHGLSLNSYNRVEKKHLVNDEERELSPAEFVKRRDEIAQTASTARVGNPEE